MELNGSGIVIGRCGANNLFVQFQDVTGGSSLTQPFAVPGETAGASALFTHNAKVKESIARGFLSYRF